MSRALMLPDASSSQRVRSGFAVGFSVELLVHWAAQGCVRTARVNRTSAVSGETPQGDRSSYQDPMHLEAHSPDVARLMSATR